MKKETQKSIKCNETSCSCNGQRRLRGKIGALLLAGGIVFMILGVMRGEAATLFTKATNVCLECIGIG